MKKIISYNNLFESLTEEKRSFLLLYKSVGTESNQCALNVLTQLSKEYPNINLLVADVLDVRDIHIKYQIQSAPSLLEFNGKEFVSVHKGCHNPEYYKNLFNGVKHNVISGETKPTHQVIVYSTPTCSWCNTLKTYLRKNNIIFRDIDVSLDDSAAKAMVQRSGQQGVPQSLIDGQVVVGFDKAKINTLLGIH
jgi:glutaredoxin-like YruB-family protein